MGSPDGQDHFELEIQPAERRQYARFQAFLPARCRVHGPEGEPLELEGKTRNLGEGGVLLLLPRALPHRIPLTVELATQTGLTGRSGVVVWVGKPELTDLGWTLIPHGIGFGQALERAFVEAMVPQARPPDPGASVEIQVDYETVVSGHFLKLSRSGIFIRTADPLPVSRILTLRFHFPGIAEPFQVQGEVIWSNPRNTSPQGMGVKFLDLPKERAEELGAFVAKVQRERGIERGVDLRGGPRDDQG